MPRRAADKAVGQLTGQDYIWSLIQHLSKIQGTFILNDVWRKTSGQRATLQDYVRRLVKAGYLEVQNSDDEGASCNVYKRIKNSLEAPRIRKDGTVLPPTKREAMWRTMRMTKKFTAQDLQVQASTIKTPVRLVDAKDYIKHLHHAGYLSVVEPAKGGRPAVYAFLQRRYTGPKPPQVQKVKQVFDPNLQKVVWPKPELNNGK